MPTPDRPEWYGARRFYLARVGMTVGCLAALQGLTEPDNVVLIVAVLAGLCVGFALRKGFRAPAG